MENSTTGRLGFLILQPQRHAALTDYELDHKRTYGRAQSSFHTVLRAAQTKRSHIKMEQMT